MTGRAGRLTEDERETLLRAWQWPQEDAPTPVVLGNVIAAVEAILRTRLAAVEAAHARDHAALARVQALGDGWVGFDNSHHYGDAVLTAIGPEFLTTDSLAALRERAEVAEAKVAAVEAVIAEWQRDLDSGGIQDPDSRYCWGVAVREAGAALADRPAGGES